MQRYMKYKQKWELSKGFLGFEIGGRRGGYYTLTGSMIESKLPACLYNVIVMDSD